MVISRHPSVFYKDNLAQSLVKTFPRLASKAVPEVPQVNVDLTASENVIPPWFAHTESIFVAI